MAKPEKLRTYYFCKGMWYVRCTGAGDKSQSSRRSESEEGTIIQTVEAQGCEDYEEQSFEIQLLKEKGNWNLYSYQVHSLILHGLSLRNKRID